MSNFFEDVNNAKLGEWVARELLETRHPKTRQVVDVRLDARYMEKDVDFLWLRTDGQLYKIEVKTDSLIGESGNIVYELTTSGNIGCFEKTEADYIFYYDMQKKIMYVFRTPALQQLVHRTINNRKIIKMGRNSTGVLISLDEIKNNQNILTYIWENAE